MISARHAPPQVDQMWRMEPLGLHCDLITKGTTPTSIGRPFTQHGVTFIKAESILETGHIDPGRTAFIDAETHRLLARSQLASGDLLISIAGVLGRVGKLDDSLLPANTNQAVAILRVSPKADLLPSFLFHLLRSADIARQIQDIAVQGAQANISLRNVAEFVVPVPGVDEQRAIAEALSDADLLIELLEKLIAKKRDIKQAAMQQLLTGKTRVLGFADVWVEKPLAELFDFAGGLSASRDQLTPDSGFATCTTATSTAGQALS